MFRYILINHLIMSFIQQSIQSCMMYTKIILYTCAYKQADAILLVE